MKDIVDHAQVEFGPRMEANILLALLAPKKGAGSAATGYASLGGRAGLILFLDHAGANQVGEELVKKNKKKKLKTHRGAAKRFKITSTGKIMRWHSGKRHLLGTKKPRRMRKLANAVVVNPSNVREHPARIAVRHRVVFVAARMCEGFLPCQAERNGCLSAGAAAFLNY